MDERKKAEIDRLVEQDQSRRALQQRAVDDTLAKESAVLTSFEHVCNETLIPLIREFADRLAAGDWSYDLRFKKEERHPDGRETPSRLSLEFWRNGAARPSVQGGAMNAFWITLSKLHGTVSFYENRGGNGGPAGDATLDELSPQLVEERLVAYLRKLLGQPKQTPS